MKQIMQPIQDILTAQTMVGRSGSNTSKTDQSLDLKGVQDALESFDSYLNRSLNRHLKSDSKAVNQQSDLLKNIPSDSASPPTEETAIGSVTGKNSQSDGKSVPLQQPGSSQPAGYITAAQNLVDDLSSEPAPGMTQSIEASHGDSYGLFDSPIYQSLIGNGSKGASASPGTSSDISSDISSGASSDIAVAAVGEAIEGDTKPTELLALSNSQPSLQPGSQPQGLSEEVAADTDLAQTSQSRSLNQPFDMHREANAGLASLGNADHKDLSGKEHFDPGFARLKLSGILNQSRGISQTTGMYQTIRELPQESLQSSKEVTKVTETKLMAMAETLDANDFPNVQKGAEKAGQSSLNASLSSATLASTPALTPTASQVNSSEVLRQNPALQQINPAANASSNGSSNISPLPIENTAVTENMLDPALDLASLKEPLMTASAKNVDLDSQSFGTTYGLNQDTSQPVNHTANQGLRLKVDTPVMQDGWNREFAMKVRTLAAAGEQQASLQLHPSELGSIEITMTTESDRAKVHFVVQSPGAREALENSLPKLREIFEEAGMSLDDTGVEDQSNKSSLSEQSGQQESALRSDEHKEMESDSSADIENVSDINSKAQNNAQLNSTIDYYI